MVSCGRNVLAIFFLLSVSASAGCTHLGVAHLNRQPWKLEESRKIEMEFMSFDYALVPRKDSFGVKGTARIKKLNVPVWVHWIGELWIQGYLSDKEGIVLAKGRQVFSPSHLNKEGSVPFDFELRPEHFNSGQLFVAFGYRMVLYENKNSESPFMAIEGAVIQ